MKRMLLDGTGLAGLFGIVALFGCGAGDGGAAATTADATDGTDSGATTLDATTDGSATDGAATDGAVATSPFDLVTNVKSLSYEGDFVVITTTDVPDHKSPFFPKDSPQYAPYDGPNLSFSTAINLMGTISDVTLKEQNITFRIPRSPKVAATHQATSLGAIGIARNGVVIFNQYNGARALLGSLEINNLDQYNGHPTHRG